MCERRTARCGKRKKKRRRYAMETFLILVFLNSTRFSRQHIIPFATMTTIFFSGRRGISSRFLSFSFPFGRSVDKTTTTTTTTTHPSGGVRRGPLRSIASSSSSSSSSSSRERERERENPQTTLLECINGESLSLSLSSTKRRVFQKKHLFC